MTSEQAFEILGIKDRNINEASLKKAFYSAARRTHPDSNPLDADAKENFHRIREAYDVLTEYLKYENRRKREEKHNKKQAAKTSSAAKTTATAKKAAGQRSAYTSAHRQGTKSNAAQNRAAANGKDVWENYSEADIKYARQRHSDASERAKETIRNHVNRENEKAAREHKARKAAQQAKHEKELQEKRMRQEAERRMWEELEAARREKQEKERAERVNRFGKVSDDEVQQFWSVFGAMFGDIKKLWNRFVTRNYRLKRIVLLLLLSALAAWAGCVLLDAVGSVAHLTWIFAVAAKWILIVWVSVWASSVVRKNWNNRLWSAFAFMIAMELAIILMNWLEDSIRHF